MTDIRVTTTIEVVEHDGKVMWSHTETRETTVGNPRYVGSDAQESASENDAQAIGALMVLFGQAMVTR